MRRKINSCTDTIDQSCQDDARRGIIHCIILITFHYITQSELASFIMTRMPQDVCIKYLMILPVHALVHLLLFQKKLNLVSMELLENVMLCSFIRGATWYFKFIIAGENNSFSMIFMKRQTLQHR